MKKNKIQNLVNMLTIVRIIGIPILFFLNNNIYLLIYLNALFITDFLDGYFARKLNVESQKGAILDLIADKFLVIFLLIVFGIQGKLSIIIVILIAIREIYSLIMRTYFLIKKNNFIGASLIGKSKTFIQFIAFDLLILNIPGYQVAFIIVIILSYYSIFDYMIKALKGKHE